MLITLRRHYCLRIVALVLCCVRPDSLFAQTLDVPVDVQLPLFAKILICDRNLSAHANGRLVIGVLYQSAFMASSAVKEEFLATAADLKLTQLKDMPVKAIDLSGTDDLAGALASEHVTVAYIAPLRAYPLSSVLEATQSRKILTLTGVGAYVDRGVSIGIGILNLRPEILINLRSVKTEGADFNANFLKLARVVK